MFNTRSNNKLPFHRSFTKRSTKQRRKWILRFAIAATVCFFLYGRWHSSSSSTESAYSLSKPGGNGPLEVQLKRPTTAAARDFKELTVARETKLLPVGERIPKIVHFVYGLRDPDPTLDLIHYIAIKSAFDVLKPEKIMFHYHYMPVGENFERARPMLTLRHIPLVDKVFDKPVSHYAHQADVVRLQVLEEFGGIYLDLDVISLKPIDHLLDREFVMAQEGVDGSVGLCNAMIMSRPHSRFVQRWYSTYSSFDWSQWNYHSVILPGKLAPFFPKEVTVLNHTSFFWPLWNSHGLRSLYLEKSYDFSANIGTHIWENAANKNLMRDVNEDVIMEIDNSLYCKIRPFLLDGKPDPRPDACRILLETERSDKMIGNWSLSPSTVSEKPKINPMPAIDDSGNNLNGLIRNGKYTEDGVYLSGDTSYIFLNVPIETSAESLTVSWWMKTPTQESGRMAMVVQTLEGRLCVKTNKLPTDALSMDVATIKRNEKWDWAQIEELKLRPSPYAVNQEEHHYTLVVNNDNQQNEPPISLYMDGHVISSNESWKFPEEIGTVVKGIWFGSIEPLSDHYEAPWDNTITLEGHYRNIQVWGRGLSATEVIQLYQSGRSVTKTTNAKKVTQKPSKEEAEFSNIEPVPNIEEDEEEEFLWADEDQIDD